MYADACKIAFGSMSNLSNYGNIFLTFMCYLQYLRKEPVDFVPIGNSNHNIDLIYVKYTLALYHNVAFMSIIS